MMNRSLQLVTTFFRLSSGAFVLIVLAGTSLFAQKKYEREYSLKKTAVPAPALEFVEGVFKGAKAHWYGEESLDGHTIEAKVKSGAKHYSVEFSKDGKLQDIEIQTRFAALPDASRKNIEEGLGKKFKSFRVMKTQEQWTGSINELKNAIGNKKPSAAVEVRYELVIRARAGDIQKYYEILCGQRGEIEQVREIIQRNADNLMY